MIKMTRLEFSWDDTKASEPLKLESVQAVAAVWLAEHTENRHGVMDIETVLDEPFSFAFNGLESYQVIELLSEIARQFPEVAFFARGIGQDFSDMWLREFKNGVPTFVAGPFTHNVPEVITEKRRGWISKLLGA